VASNRLSAVINQRNILQLSNEPAKDRAMTVSERTMAETARMPVVARPGMIPDAGSIRTPAGTTLQALAAIAMSLLLLLMTLEGVAARKPGTARSSGLAAASPQDSRMMQQSDTRAQYSTHRSHRKMVRPAPARHRAHASKMRDNPAKTSVARRYDRPGSYFLHGTRF